MSERITPIASRPAEFQPYPRLNRIRVIRQLIAARREEARRDAYRSAFLEYADYTQRDLDNPFE